MIYAPHYSIILARLLVELDAKVQKDKLEYVFFVFRAAVLEFCLQIVEILRFVSHLFVYNSHLLIWVPLIKLSFNLLIVYAAVASLFSCKMFIFHLHQTFSYSVHLLRLLKTQLLTSLHRLTNWGCIYVLFAWLLLFRLFILIIYGLRFLWFQA